MANTSSRTLRLLSLLQTHRFWPGTELAARLGVSPRTLRRDVDRLRELGYPVEASRGVDGGYQLAPGAVLPPLVVDDEEAVAIAVALQDAAVSGGLTGIAESSVRALSKVIQVLPGRLRRRVDALRTMTVSTSLGSVAAAVDTDALTTLAQACRDTERVRFEYTAPNREPGTRSVEPYRLVSIDHRWYLVGYDLDRGDWRSFRIDRLTGPRRTGARFRQRELPAGDAAEFVRAGLRKRPGTYAVHATVSAPRESVQSRIGRWWEVGPDDSGDPGRCTVHMESDWLDWPAMALGTLGAEFEVHSPAELRELLRDWGERFTRAGTRPGG
ncbi:helix-turn-helix transcriptional regulator [Sciscionella marina]|uniref:helix-turn-helix transcriptional regulator n=1 Tax=Sciscionella marina TaxID=508770 RepID=UPI000367E5DE|nr:YafY family protein [Sciscionella marina]